MNTGPTNEQNIHNENTPVDTQNNIQGNNNTVTNYPATKQPEIQDFNFPKPIDSFKGRVDEFKQLNDYLFGIDNRFQGVYKALKKSIQGFFQDARYSWSVSSKDEKMVVIWGLPGFGKTELLKQFAQKCKLNNKIKYICWLQASNKDALTHSLTELVKILNLPEVDDLRVLLQTVSHRYQNSETLFVFDDVESPRSLLDWETPISCWTLVSSKFREWDKGSNQWQSVKMGPLKRHAAVAVLQHQQDPVVMSESKSLRTLAKLLDCAPLALQLAAAYMREETKLFPENFDIPKYIKTLKTSRRKLINEPVPSFLPYEYCIQEAMNLSLENIRNLNTFESNLALDILNIIPYLNQYYTKEESILNFSFIQNKLKEEDEDEERESEKEIRRALDMLQSYSFVRLEDGFIRIHGLVQQTIISNHNKPNANLESYYTACLQYVLDNNFDGHSLTILKHADKKLKIFKQFYDEYKSKIINEYKANSNKKIPLIYNIIQNMKDSLINNKILLQVRDYIKSTDDNIKEDVFNSIISNANRSFLGKLVIANAEKCLTIVFDELGSQAKNVIIDHQLLFDAIDSQETNMIKLLQKYEKDIIKKTTAEDYDILMYTISCLNLDILNFILEHNNIDVNARGGKGYTCLSYLISFTLEFQLHTGDLINQMMRTLVDHGASVYNVDNEGCSLLHVAVSSIKTAMHLKVVKFIVDDLQVNVDTTDICGSTALHLILYRRVRQEIDDDDLTMKVVYVLVKRGASVHIKNNDGESPIDIIKKYKLQSLFPIEFYTQTSTHDEN